MKRIQNRIIITAAVMLALLAGSCNQPFGAFMANRALLSFTLTEPAASGTIGDDTVSLTVPAGTNVTALVPTFTFLGQEVRVGDTVQTSGVSEQDFTLPVVYTVVSWDGGTTEYTVTVTVTAAPPAGPVIPTTPWAKSLVSYPGAGFAAFNDVVVDAEGNVYAVGYQEEFEFSELAAVDYGDSVTLNGADNYSNAVIVKYTAGGTVEWGKTVESASADTVYNAVAVDSTGNIWAAGYQYGTAKVTYGDGFSATATGSGNNAVLVKYGSDSTVLGAWTVTGSGLTNSEFNGLAVDSSGNVYAVGYQEGSDTYNYDGSAFTAGVSSGKNAVLVKFDSGGTGQWAKSTFSGIVQIPATSSDSIFTSITVDASGDIYTAGYQFKNPLDNGSNFFYAENTVYCSGVDNAKNGMVVKYNNSGTAQWAQSISRTAGTGYSELNTVAVADNSVFVAGNLSFYDSYPSEYFTFGNGVQINELDISGEPYALTTAMIAGYDASDGNAQWARCPSITGGASSFRNLTVDSNETICVAGYQSLGVDFTYGPGVTVSGGAESANNAVLVSYNSSGDTLNALSVSCDVSGASEHLAVTTDAAGNIYTAGSLNDTYTYTYSTFSDDVLARGVNNSGGSNIALVKYGPMP